MNNYNFEDLTLGMSESFEAKVTLEDMKAFEIISGDINPLHLNEEYAHNKGFTGRVVYGMLHSAFYSRLVGVHLPGQNCLLLGIDISFKKPVYADDSLVIEGKISHLSPATQTIEIKALIRNQNNQKVSSALIKVAIK